MDTEIKRAQVKREYTNSLIRVVPFVQFELYQMIFQSLTLVFREKLSLFKVGQLLKKRDKVGQLWTTWTSGTSGTSGTKRESLLTYMAASSPHRGRGWDWGKMFCYG